MLTFRPDLHPTVWGGHSLRQLKGLEPSADAVGESWEVSTIPGAISVVADGPLAGTTLTDLIRRYGQELVGRRAIDKGRGELPLLVKFIDAEADLSVQVHPDDHLAQSRHHSRGKSEMWYVVDARPGASLLVGFSRQLSPESYAKSVADGSLVSALQRHEVHPGDVFHIPPGTVHSICPGVLLCEIQQSSDITYRIYDYHRLGLDGQPRQLHVEEAQAAINFSALTDHRVRYTQPHNGAATLVTDSHFAVSLLSAQAPLSRNRLADESYVTLSCVQGRCHVTLDIDTLRRASLARTPQPIGQPQQQASGHPLQPIGQPLQQPIEQPLQPIGLPLQQTNVLPLQPIGLSTVTLTPGNSCLIPASEAAYIIHPDPSTGVRLLEAVAM